MPASFYSSSRWRLLRYEALKRDGWRCVECHANVRTKGARVDHILPRSTHPHLALAISNLRVRCRECGNGRVGEQGGKRIERVPVVSDALAAAWVSTPRTETYAFQAMAIGDKESSDA